MQTGDEGAQVFFRATEKPGLYRLRMGGQKPDVLFAAQRDPQESVFEKVPESELKAMQVALKSSRKDVPLRLAENRQQLLAWIGNDPRGQELWPALALMALGLLVGEILLSRRIARRREMDRPGVAEFATVEDVFSGRTVAGRANRQARAVTRADS